MSVETECGCIVTLHDDGTKSVEPCAKHESRRQDHGIYAH